MSEFTRILAAAEQGDAKAAHELLPLVYGELRRLAAHKLAGQAAGQTLQPTALVHEAWLRLIGNENPRFNDRRHFFAAAAEAMRHILIDKARRKNAQRRGGGQQPLDSDQLDIAAPDCDDSILAVNDALDQLARQQPVQAEVVKLHFFVGMTLEEVAEVMGISVRTVDRHWARARLWLYQQIGESGVRGE